VDQNDPGCKTRLRVVVGADSDGPCEWVTDFDNTVFPNVELAVSTGAGSAAAALPHHQGSRLASADAVRSAVLTQLACKVLTWIIIYFDHLEMRDSLGTQGNCAGSTTPAPAAAAARGGGGKCAEWLASAWWLELANGVVRLPVPDELGSALLAILDPSSGINHS